MSALFRRLLGRPEQPAGSEPTAAPSPPEGGIPFVGFTDEWRLEGVMAIDGSVWTVLNRRESINIADVRWGPLDGSAPMEPAPGLRIMHPYDLVVALSVPAASASGPDVVRGATVKVDVVLDCPPLRVVGTVRVRPGEEPDSLLLNQPELFIPVGGAIAFLERQPLPVPSQDLVLVNRAYLRDARSVDPKTMEAVRPLARAALERIG